MPFAPFLVAAVALQKPTISGGALRYEQAVYDVLSYDVSLNVSPESKSLSGKTTIIAKTVIPTNVILVDLDSPFAVSAVTGGDGKALKYDRTEDAMRIWFPESKQVGQEITVTITYAGMPRVAPNAPWTGGTVWAKTPTGSPWVSVALQGDGADLLFPCKDHPSDKPSTAWMRLTVPKPLVAVGPGKLESTKENANGTTTYNWFMPVPIANYSIVFNAAPYKLLHDTAKSVAGETVPIDFYVLPEDADKGPKLIAEVKKYLAFYEKYLGPFPFRTIKLGMVETPHLGMEHSTAIAYGNHFRFRNGDNLDWLLLHEFGHEWWANLVTASDWRDFWIHEGFQTYMDCLYEEHLGSQQAYFDAMKRQARGLRNRQAVAPRDPKISYEVYNAGPDFVNSDGDIYGKGGLILHALRYLLGDADFFKALRHMAYPTKESEAKTDGSQERLVCTDDFQTIVERDSGKQVGWFFEVYLRQPRLPKLVSTLENGTLNLQWETANNLPFPMPIEVVIDGKATRIPMTGGKGSIAVPAGQKAVIDPNGWVLRVPEPR